MRPRIATINDDFRFFMYPETVARGFLIKCFSFLHKKSDFVKYAQHMANQGINSRFKDSTQSIQFN